MAYVPTTFVDRSVEFPNRRKLTAVSSLADTFDVARAEGTVFAEGTKPDAANLNAEFGKIKTETDAINTNLQGKLTYPDYTNIITTINTQGASWTATENCWLIGIAQQTDIGFGAVVYVNGIIVCAAYVFNSTSTETTCCIPVKAGQIVTTRAGHGTYTLKAYGMA